jgi:hypothetical protein
VSSGSRRGFDLRAGYSAYPPYSPAIGTSEQLGLLYGGYSAGGLVTTPLFVRYYI